MSLFLGADSPEIPRGPIYGACALEGNPLQTIRMVILNRSQGAWASLYSMNALKIAAALYIIQAGVGFAVGFTIPWLQFFHVAGY